MYLNCHAIFIYLTLQGFMCMNVAYSFIELTKLLRYRHRYHCLEHGIWASTSTTADSGVHVLDSYFLSVEPHVADV